MGKLTQDRMAVTIVDSKESLVPQWREQGVQIHFHVQGDERELSGSYSVPIDIQSDEAEYKYVEAKAREYMDMYARVKKVQIGSQTLVKMGDSYDHYAYIQEVEQERAVPQRRMITVTYQLQCDPENPQKCVYFLTPGITEDNLEEWITEKALEYVAYLERQSFRSFGRKFLMKMDTDEYIYYVYDAEEVLNPPLQEEFVAWFRKGDKEEKKEVGIKITRDDKTEPRPPQPPTEPPSIPEDRRQTRISDYFGVSRQAQTEPWGQQLWEPEETSGWGDVWQDLTGTWEDLADRPSTPPMTTSPIATRTRSATNFVEKKQIFYERLWNLGYQPTFDSIDQMANPDMQIDKNCSDYELIHAADCLGILKSRMDDSDGESSWKTVSLEDMLPPQDTEEVTVKDVFGSDLTEPEEIVAKQNFAKEA